MKIGIIGGGIIGLGIGWQLLRRGAEVTLFEKGTIGQESSYAAAGMLAPYAEVGFEEIELMKLGQESLRLYPKFINELAEDTENVPEIDRCGTMLVGVDRDDTEHLRRLYDFREKLSLTVEMITGTEAREREPLLSPKVVSAVWLPDDAQIDNRALVQCLKEAFTSCGGLLLEQNKVTQIHRSGGAVKGVSTPSSNFQFDKVVLAAGCWSRQVSGIPDKLKPPIRPVKGQIITMQKTPDCELKGIVRSPRFYLVPKEDGTIRLGATSEEKGFDKMPTAGGQKELLEEAWEAVPSIYDLPLIETIAGLRPASRDHAPIIGQTRMKGLYYATGHYRHGILLTPVTVYSIVEEILNDSIAEAVKSFRPGRFSKTGQEA
ncbi:glycine oxidase ThiO [Aliifodinibius sp. S!AR15-10]|uniref:glycine oxidase ThiO n=1 Tax=Aliifodinibius sp. S!AR15-10 TaxID=2950437 RepID=UPI0028552F5A|nr:glycine oxidase ThiO [Aliifodinibius sp. S!AR15-10]MDR8393678.1 glycine oxidase ThiO [Aliifodinibius sp. S!AR15-10]